MYRVDISTVAAAGPGAAPPRDDSPRRYPEPVSFRADHARGAGAIGGPASAAGGAVDYRLARNSVVSEFRKGRLSRRDVCDAHPELLRAARNVGEARSEPCPICAEPGVVLVSYAFGSRLPAHGRCVTSGKELARLQGRVDGVTFYVVEVCPDCSWNHLVRTFSVGGRRG